MKNTLEEVAQDLFSMKESVLRGKASETQYRSAEHHAEMGMRESISEQTNDLKGKILTVVESLGLENKQEEAAKMLIKMFVNSVWAQLDNQFQEYSRIAQYWLQSKGAEPVSLNSVQSTLPKPDLN